MAKTTDLAAMVRQLRAHTEDGITTPELAKMLGCGKDKANKIRDELVRAGKLEPTMLRRKDAWGTVYPVKGFRVVP